MGPGSILQLTTTMRDEASSELNWAGDEIWTDPDMFVGDGEHQKVSGKVVWEFGRLGGRVRGCGLWVYGGGGGMNTGTQRRDLVRVHVIKRQTVTVNLATGSSQHAAQRNFENPRNTANGTHTAHLLAIATDSSAGPAAAFPISSPPRAASTFPSLRTRSIALVVNGPLWKTGFGLAASIA